MSEERENRIVDAINKLAAARTRLAGYQAEVQAAVDKYLAPHKSKIDKIKAAKQPKIDTVSAKIAELEKTVREYVAEHKETVRGTEAPEGGTALQCLYMRPSVKWNSDMLEGMKALIPELEKARSEVPNTPQIRSLALDN